MILILQHTVMESPSKCSPHYPSDLLIPYSTAESVYVLEDNQPVYLKGTKRTD